MKRTLHISELVIISLRCSLYREYKNKSKKKKFYYYLQSRRMNAHLLLEFVEMANVLILWMDFVACATTDTHSLSMANLVKVSNIYVYISEIKIDLIFVDASGCIKKRILSDCLAHTWHSYNAVWTNWNDIKTLKRRPNNVVLTSCAGWFDESAVK